MAGLKITGSRIRRARKRQGLRQEDLAAMLHTSTNTVARWEREERQPRGLYRLTLETWIREAESRPPWSMGGGEA